MDPRRDFVFIADLVAIATRFAEEGTPGGVWHVGSGYDISIAEIYREVRGSLGIPDEPFTVQPRGEDDAETILVDPTATNDAFRWWADSDLESGISAAVAWYQQNGVSDTFTHLKEPVRS